MLITRIIKGNLNVQHFFSEAGSKIIIHCCGGEVVEGKICPYFSIHKTSHENVITTTICYMNFNNFTLALYLLMSLLFYDACLTQSDLIIK